ncbi:hypothetical protein F7731_06385 [Cytobacillus depressus]|uniref:Uncharacterized protein n=1 Tax=Cytobacillus depressus TaxID=1602942 RepID=A0A6L3V9M8_9BACI|nr:hypothetical protein [Cytobacillus depressus]KAB2337243.1 hypothetical protein F7731_06385 [Cytobacillus depressus]
MGYIAPVNQYQYRHYAERERLNKYDPYRFVPIKRINSTINPPENEHILQTIPPHSNKKSAPKVQLMPMSHIDRVYGEITGIGQNYSSYA